MTKKLQAQFDELAQSLEQTSKRCCAARTAHFSVPGNYFDTPGPTLDAYMAAEAELKQVLNSARAFANSDAIRKFGVVTVHGEPGSLCFMAFDSRQQIRRRAAVNEAYESVNLDEC